MEFITLKCKNCNKKLMTYIPPSSRKYKSPLKTCKKCGTEYLDPRCHEIAAEGLPPDTYSITSNVIMGIVGGLILWRGLYLFTVHQLGTSENIQWLYHTTFTVMGIFCILFAIYQIIIILTGIKRKKFEKLRQESEERLQDYNYAKTLVSLGYSVPEEYL